MVYQALLKTISNVNKYQFDSEKKFGSFIFTVFCNLIRRYYRDKKRNSERIQFLSFDEALYDEAKETPNLKTEREVQRKLVEEFICTYWNESSDSNLYLNCLERALNQLEDWEKILLLQRAQNVPYSEIAHFVDKPVGQLKVYHQRTRKKLLKYFAEYYQNEVNEE